MMYVSMIVKRRAIDYQFDYNNRQYQMKAKQAPRKFKRYLTEPDELAAENRKKYSQLTLKQLKLQVAAMDHMPAYAPAPPHYHNNNHNQPQRIPLYHQNGRTTLDRLPELLNTPHFNNGNQRTVPHPPIFRTSNPLFVVNTLFNMIKEDTEGTAKAIEKVQSRGIRNEFEEITAKSVKIHRPPRLLDHQFTRLTHQSAFSRRKIYSQEKARPKQEQPREELLTFYPKKPCLSHNSQLV